MSFNLQDEDKPHLFVCFQEKYGILTFIGGIFL